MTIKEQMKKREKFDKLVSSLGDLYDDKNIRYDNSFGNLIQEEGLIVAVSRLGDKYNRFKSLYKASESECLDESVVDTLKDLANYTLITLLELGVEE